MIITKKHIDIIRALATSRQGLTQKELFSKVKDISAGGGAVTILDELESCGFILRIAEFGKKKKDTRYRLIDSLSLFYLKWVEGITEISSAYWLRMQGTQAYNTWAGYAFENVCFQHYPQIIKALELTVVAKAKSGWRYIPQKNAMEEIKEEGAQIDMLVDRADKCINLCETKFYESEFVIDKAYAEKLRKKKNCFREKTGTKKTLFTTLITVYGAQKNKYYLNAVDQQLTMDAFF